MLHQNIFDWKCSRILFQAVRDLASTHVSDGAILPYVDVYCSRVARMLPIETERHAFFARLEALGRALGRVIAHELYHIFGQTQKHGRWGLAQPCHRRS